MPDLTLDLIARAICCGRRPCDMEAKGETCVACFYTSDASNILSAILSAELTEEQVYAVMRVGRDGPFVDQFRAILRTLLPRGSIVDTEA